MILIISIQNFMKQPDKDKIAILRLVAKGEMKIIDLEVSENGSIDRIKTCAIRK